MIPLSFLKAPGAEDRIERETLARQKIIKPSRRCSWFRLINAGLHIRPV
jgi:hypothetical protein